MARPIFSRWIVSRCSGVLAALMLVPPVPLAVGQVPPPPSLPAPAGNPGDFGGQPGGTIDGLEPLEQGPVHEAFAELVMQASQSELVAPKAPPQPVNEIPPEIRPEGTRVEWFSGYWSWHDDLEDFIWVSGVWRDVPPGQQFVPGYWHDNGDGTWQWVPGFWNTIEQQEYAYLPPPPQTLEIAPTYPQPAPEYFWVPGCWVYRPTGYAWQAGFWHRGQPNWVWIPNRYRWTPRGFVFCRGYWDYPLARRGLLFSPIGFRRPLFVNVGFRYTPYRWVNSAFLLNRLYIAPGRGHYFFGNFGAPRYASLGFRPWIQVTQIRGGYDPFFSYYSWSERRNPNWINTYRNDFNRLASQPLDIPRGGGANTWNALTRNNDPLSRDLFRDLRQVENDRGFVRLNREQLDTSVRERITALNNLREARVDVESRPALRDIVGNGRPEGTRPTLPGTTRPGGEGTRPAEGTRPGGEGTTSGRGPRLPETADLANSGERPSFRIPDQVRDVLNRGERTRESASRGESGTRPTIGNEDRIPGTGSQGAGQTLPDRGNRLPGTDRPNQGGDRPTPGTERPAPGTNRPAPGTGRPTPGSELPEAGSNRPAPGTERPTPSMNRPTLEGTRPTPGNTGRPTVDPANRVPGTTRPAPGTENRVPGTGGEDSGRPTFDRGPRVPGGDRAESGNATPPRDLNLPGTSGGSELPRPVPGTRPTLPGNAGGQSPQFRAQSPSDQGMQRLNPPQDRRTTPPLGDRTPILRQAPGADGGATQPGTRTTPNPVLRGSGEGSPSVSPTQPRLPLGVTPGGQPRESGVNPATPGSVSPTQPRLPSNVSPGTTPRGGAGTPGFVPSDANRGSMVPNRSTAPPSGSVSPQQPRTPSFSPQPGSSSVPRSVPGGGGSPSVSPSIPRSPGGSTPSFTPRSSSPPSSAPNIGGGSPRSGGSVAPPGGGGGSFRGGGVPGGGAPGGGGGRSGPTGGGGGGGGRGGR